VLATYEVGSATSEPTQGEGTHACSNESSSGFTTGPGATEADPVDSPKDLSKSGLPDYHRCMPMLRPKGVSVAQSDSSRSSWSELNHLINDAFLNLNHEGNVDSASAGTSAGVSAGKQLNPDAPVWKPSDAPLQSSQLVAERPANPPGTKSAAQIRREKRKRANQRALDTAQLQSELAQEELNRLKELHRSTGTIAANEQPLT
jgi:hypothetical protein